MAQFNYADYVNAKLANGGGEGSNGNGPQVHYLNEYLKNDGDSVIVRFPYHSLNDLFFDSTHLVEYPNRRYPARVSCSGKDCPLCMSGVPIAMRFFVKALAYIADTNNNVQIINTVWDRPSAFADIELKTLFEEYGDISQQLFKIKRNGKGKQTRYTATVVLNNTVYNPEIYKADFTELNQVNPRIMLTKTMDQYLKAIETLNTTSADTTMPEIPAETPMPTVNSTLSSPVVSTAQIASITTSTASPVMPTPAAAPAVPVTPTAPATFSIPAAPAAPAIPTATTPERPKYVF